MNVDTMSARARMLQRLRGHAPAAPSPTLEALDARIDAHFTGRRALAPLALNERIAQFQRMLEAAHAEVICASAATWAAELADRLAAAGVRSLLLDTACAEGQALEAALPSAVQARSYAQPIEQWKAELFDTVDAGFTVARSGLAATGTLVVVPDANAPRTVSLVPPLHVALIHARTLHADLHAAVAAERWRDGMPTNLVMISGPSKTSDIQQTTAYGAHGPRALWVVLVTDEDRATGTQHGAAE
ncbi:lactate utilization protein C [Paraburkholderia sp. BR10936]|uniref:lactate utilization protein C n=1 Tax=Paraburkholderia sp. BR10936 TaxID=3236993 RepID=UPI0034D1D829